VKCYSGYAFHLNFVYIRQWLAIERSILRLPRNCVGTGASNDVRGHEFLAVGQDRACLDNPLVRPWLLQTPSPMPPSALANSKLWWKEAKVRIAKSVIAFIKMF
jgi:hypothetical protein